MGIEQLKSVEGQHPEGGQHRPKALSVNSPGHLSAESGSKPKFGPIVLLARFEPDGKDGREIDRSPEACYMRLIRGMHPDWSDEDLRGLLQRAKQDPDTWKIVQDFAEAKQIIAQKDKPRCRVTKASS